VLGRKSGKDALGSDVDHVDVGLLPDWPACRDQRSKNWNRLPGPVIEMINFKAARCALACCSDFALIASLNLKPKVEKGTILCNSFAVKVAPNVSVGGHRPHQTFGAEPVHDERRRSFP
jgi:hypothetical protein